jgi:hypothetical protein
MQVIADRNEDDLALLQSCVDALHSEDRLSPSVGKLRRVCRVFYQVAKLYMEQGPLGTNTQRPPGDQVQGGSSASTASKQSVVSSVTAQQVQQLGQYSNGDPQSLYLFPTPSTAPQAHVDFTDIDLPDFPLSHEDWTGMLDGADLGLGAENARDMSSYFEQYFAGVDIGTNVQADGNAEDHHSADPGRLPLIPGQRGLFQ